MLFMNSNKKQVVKLGNLGKILDFTPPLLVTKFDTEDFKAKFGSQLSTLLENDELASSQSFLLGRENKSVEKKKADLLTYEDENWQISDFVSALVELWLFLKTEVTEAPFIYDPDDFIAKILVLTDIIRRKDAAAAFGSKSKEERDEVLRPAKEIVEKMKMLEKNINNDLVYGLSPAIKIQFVKAKADFEKFKFALERYEVFIASDDLTFKQIYTALQKDAGDKSYVTQIINALIKDLIDFNIEVGTKYKDKSWVRKLNEKNKYEKKKKSSR